jgi:hypothetical protein
MPCKCIVGRADPQLTAAVDSALKAGMSIRKVAAKFGFPSATVGRHSKNCTEREIAELHRASKPQFDPYTQRLWLKLPWESENRLIADIKQPRWWSTRKPPAPQNITNVRLVVQFDGGNFCKSPAEVERELLEANSTLDSTTEENIAARAQESQTDPCNETS